MRRRSETIYADNEADYLKVTFKLKFQILKKNDSLKKPSNISRNPSKIEKENDCLSSKILFALEEKQMSFTEREIYEEETLIKTVENLSYSIKNKDKKFFLQNLTILNNSTVNLNNFERTCVRQNSPKRTSSFNNFDIQNVESSKYNISSLLENCSTRSSNTLEKIICQNLEVTDEKIKIMVIGDKHVGKSLLISKFMNNFKVLKNLTYSPTERYLKIFKSVLKLKIKQ